MLLSLLSLLLASAVTSMPYRVPLQGNLGGKRTLILLDDIVRIVIAYLNDCFLIPCSG